jgi:hypothetical protein
MNNYHLFLIRSDSITQIAAHLLAGIIALVFLANLGSHSDRPLPELPAAQITAVSLPAGTSLLAARE